MGTLLRFGPTLIGAPFVVWLVRRWVRIECAITAIERKYKGRR